MLPRAWFTVLAVFTFGILPGCSQGPTPDDLAAVDALNKWWKESNFTPPPQKPGTITLPTTFTYKGKVVPVRKHVQTVKEFQDETVDAQFMERRQALIRGFSVKGKTVTALTNLTRDSVSILDHDRLSTNDAQALCQSLGGFVWANQNRHFGLEDIKITGANGELLSSRFGITGKVQ